MRDALSRHVRSRQIALAHSLHDRQAIYLDIKFWIILRDVVEGRRTTAQERELLELLRRDVQHAKIFCPISDIIFLELLKNGDVLERSRTAELIDELSLGVTLVPFELRANTEIAHFLHSARGSSQLYSRDELVWSKLSYAMGFMHPSQLPFDERTELPIQRSFFDHMWDIPMSRMIEIIGGRMPPGDGVFGGLAARLNGLNRQHTSELRTFKQTYESELHGVLDLFGDALVTIIESIVLQDFDSIPKRTVEQRQEEARLLHNLLFAALQNDANKLSLPTFDILATMHAAVRWNRQQNLEANDFLDFQHAAAALGYCDAFLTERPLRGLLTAAHVALDRRHSCQVIADIEDAVTFLRAQIN